MKFFKVRKNTKRLLSVCEGLIEKYEGRTNSSCKHDVLSSITEQLKNHKDEIYEWPDDFNYTRLAHVLVLDTCSNLVSSGRYHIYTGQLNPMKCGHAMVEVYIKCLEYGVATNELTEEEKNENISALRSQIAWVG